ncbi:MAG: FKBP-type peptidyl-prolyl cis-trans isomerase [Candidatus Woesearchaeota archaeon]
MKKLMFLIILSVILLSSCAKKAEVGDKVKVFYVGKFEDGKIFDTNKIEVAKENKMFNLQKNYEPLQFEIGEKQVIAGFEEDIIGMKVGEKKTLTIPPEKGYGQYNPRAITSIPRINLLNRTAKIPRVMEFTMSKFQGLFKKEPEVGVIYNTEALEWGYKVLEIKENLVLIEAQVKKGEKYKLPDTEWESEVVEVSKDTVLFRQNPKEGQKITTSIGEIEIHVKKDALELISTPNIGEMIMTSNGPAKIKEVREKEIIVDTNHPLAGKTLIFDVELVDILD